MGYNFRNLIGMELLYLKKEIKGSHIKKELSSFTHLFIFSGTIMI